MDFDWDDIVKEPEPLKSIEDILSLIGKISRGYQHFYVLGGSQCSLYYDNEISTRLDIDIFFETEDDFIRMNDSIDLSVSTESKYAITYPYNQYNIQLIRHRFGNVDDHFNNFDISATKIGFEFKGVLEKYSAKNITRWMHHDFKGPLKIHFNNFRTGTPSRFLKYIEKVHVKVPNKKMEIFRIVDHCIENFNTEFQPSYNETKPILGKDILSNLSAKLLKYGDSGINHELTDKILSASHHLSMRDQLHIWKWIEPWNIKNQYYFDDHPFYLLYPQEFKSKMSKENIQKYAQYFI